MAWAIPVEVQNGQLMRTKRYIMHALGYPNVTPPISEESVNECIEDAISMWYDYMSTAQQYMVLDYWLFTTSPKQNLYPLDPCIDPGKVKTVIYNPQNYSLFNIAFNQNFDFLFFTTQEQIPELTTFYLALMKQEFVNMVLGQEGTYEIIGSPPMIHLMPTPTTAINVGVLFARLPDLATLEKIRWIRECALALSKVRVGEILSRYTNIPGAMGDMQLNGADLKQEGIAKQEKLMEEMRQMTDIYHIHTDFERY